MQFAQRRSLRAFSINGNGHDGGGKIRCGKDFRVFALIFRRIGIRAAIGNGNKRQLVAIPPDK